MQPHEILEELRKRQYVPQLLTNYLGQWTIIDTAFYQQDILYMCADEDAVWHTTITEAVNAYLKETGEEL